MAQQFEVEEVSDNVVPLTKPSAADKAILNGVMLALKALGQGAAIALGHVARHVVALFAAASVFWLWMSIPDPNQYQIIWATIYAMFVLVLNLMLVKK